VWSFIHKLGSPRWFYRITTPWLPWLALLTAGLLLTGAVWGLAFAPADFRQGNSYRIIFIHVPTAFVSLAGYYLMATAGAFSLIWKIKLADMALRAAAGIGAAMTFCALVTGSIWGRPTWGTWWVWDARITSMLVLLFLYLGVLALYEAFENRDTSARACAVLSLVGTVNIPIIYKSVDWWYSLHQPATIKLTGAPSMHPDMFLPLVLMILGFYALYALVLVLRLRAEVIEREQKSRWVEELALGHEPVAEPGP
jgi:heme exporter protein C